MGYILIITPFSSSCLFRNIWWNQCNKLSHHARPAAVNYPCHMTGACWPHSLSPLTLSSTQSEILYVASKKKKTHKESPSYSPNFCISWQTHICLFIWVRPPIWPPLVLPVVSALNPIFCRFAICTEPGGTPAGPCVSDNCCFLHRCVAIFTVMVQMQMPGYDILCYIRLLHNPADKRR